MASTTRSRSNSPKHQSTVPDNGSGEDFHWLLGLCFQGLTVLQRLGWSWCDDCWRSLWKVNLDFHAWWLVESFKRTVETCNSWRRTWSRVDSGTFKRDAVKAPQARPRCFPGCFCRRWSNGWILWWSHENVETSEKTSLSQNHANNQTHQMRQWVPLQAAPLSKLRQPIPLQQSLAELKRAPFQLLRLVLSKPVAVQAQFQKEQMVLRQRRWSQKKRRWIWFQKGITPAANVESAPSRSYGLSLEERMRLSPYARPSRRGQSTPPPRSRFDEVFVGSARNSNIAQKFCGGTYAYDHQWCLLGPAHWCLIDLRPRKAWDHHIPFMLALHPCHDLQANPFSWKSLTLMMIQKLQDKLQLHLLVPHGGLTEKRGEKHWSRTQKMVFHLPSQKLLRATVSRIDACTFPLPSLHVARWTFQSCQKLRRFSSKFRERRSWIVWLRRVQLRSCLRRTSLYACLQLAASRRWKTRVKDVKAASLQSLPTTGTKLLACRLPRDETPEGLDGRQLLLLKTENIRTGLRAELVAKNAVEGGYRAVGLCGEVNCYDRCVLTLPSKSSQPGSPSEGFIVIEVDDIAEAGGAEHVKRMKKLEAMLRFGKVEDLQSEQGTNYAGRFLRQLPDFSFESNMGEFIYTRLEPIVTQRKVLKKNAADVKLSEGEKTQPRGLIASLTWVSREGRPDASSAASILASSFPSPTMEQIFAANDVV